MVLQPLVNISSWKYPWLVPENSSGLRPTKVMRRILHFYSYVL